MALRKCAQFRLLFIMRIGGAHNARLWLHKVEMCAEECVHTFAYSTYHVAYAMRYGSSEMFIHMEVVYARKSFVVNSGTEAHRHARRLSHMCVCVFFILIALANTAQAHRGTLVFCLQEGTQMAHGKNSHKLTDYRVGRAM